MDIGDLYQFVLLLVLVGMIIGVGVLVLDKFNETSGISSGASDAIENASSAIGTVSTTWMSLIVTVAILAIILTLIIRSFSFRR